MSQNFEKLIAINPQTRVKILMPSNNDVHFYFLYDFSVKVNCCRCSQCVNFEAVEDIAAQIITELKDQ